MRHLQAIQALAFFALAICAVPASSAQNSNPYSSFQWTGFFEELKAAQNRVAVKNNLPQPERGKAFQDIRKDGGLLVGFEFTNGDWFGAPLFQSIQPIYLTPNGKVLGTRRGNAGHDPFRIEAKDGYAVSSIKLHGDTSTDPFLFSVQLTFTKIDLVRRALDTADSYKSEIHGALEKHPEWAPERVLGSGLPIVGIYGYAENEINSFGVVSSPATR